MNLINIIFVNDEATAAATFERLKSIQKGINEKRTVVENERKMTDAIEELESELKGKDFGSLMSEIVKSTKTEPKKEKD